MSDTYKIGINPCQISLRVNIVSTSPAATQAFVMADPASATQSPVANSTDATGNIPQQVIGDQTLTGKRLGAYTKVTLLGYDAAARAALAPNITGIYTLSGGEEGVKTFKDSVNTYNDPDVFLLFVSDFV